MTSQIQRQCQHEGCTSRGTHILVFVIQARTAPTPDLPRGVISKKRDVQPWRYCEAHQEKDPEKFFLSHPHWWREFAEDFARFSFAKHGHVMIAARGLTQIRYMPEDGIFEEIPIYTVDGDRLEEVGKTKLVTV